MFPNMIGMPMPAPEHLDCLEKWVIHGEVCPKLRARSASDVDGEFVYGDQFGLAWEVNLIFFYCRMIIYFGLSLHLTPQNL